MSNPETTARATLAQLKRRWRASGFDGAELDPKKPPQLVLTIGTIREVWKLLQANKEDSVYELIETGPQGIQSKVPEL